MIPKTSGELVASKTCMEGVASIPTSGESRLNVESMVSTLSLKGSKKNLRPVFYHQDNPKLEIKASGILPYTFNKKGKMFILFRLHKKKGIETLIDARLNEYYHACVLCEKSTIHTNGEENLSVIENLKGYGIKFSFCKLPSIINKPLKNSSFL